MKKESVSSLWKRLFDSYDILNKVEKDGHFIITADQIKEYNEPRLMTKFDEYSQMPEIFRDHGLSVVSNSRKSYIIGRFSLFSALDYKDSEMKTFQSQKLETLQFSDLYSESVSLMFAFNNGILKKAFDADSVFFTTYGRRGTDNFSFQVDLKDSDGKPTDRNAIITVNKAQIEIDGGFETEDSFYIIEAKNRHVDDINLRQLYYPYVLWSSKIEKKVVPVFFINTDCAFFIYICKFEDPKNINSLKVVKSLRFAPEEESITKEDVMSIFRDIKPSVNKEVTFPQADRMEKVLDLLNLLLLNKTTSNDEITEYFGFDERQTYYYVDAAMFLGLVQRDRGACALTKLGMSVMKEQRKERNLKLIRLILQDRVFYKAFDHFQKEQEIPDKDFIKESIKANYPPKKGNSGTPERRSQTVAGWLGWIIELIHS